MAGSRTRIFAAMAFCGFATCVPAQPPPPPPPPPPPGPLSVPCLAQSPAGQATEGQTATAAPSLDVISVKANKTGGGMMRLMNTPDGISITNLPIHLLLTQGYHIDDDQLIGEPEWSKSEHFDIEAKVSSEDAPAVPKLRQDQRRMFFQQVLKERFGLVAHHETRELPEYLLVVAKGGSKLKESKEEDCTDASGTPGKRRGGTMTINMSKGNMTLKAMDSTMQSLLQILSNETHRIVIDKTDLPAKYDFTLSWSAQMNAAPAGGDAAADAAPDLFTAIQEQLGLKLEPMKGPVDVVVIDHLERPGEN